MHSPIPQTAGAVARLVAIVATCLLMFGLLVGCGSPVAPLDPTGDPGPAPQPEPKDAIWNYLEIDFDSSVDGYCEGAFSAGGLDTSPAAGQLDSDAWSVSGFSDGDLPFGGSAVSGDLARGSSPGGVTTGGLYAFSVSDQDVAMGVQPTAGDFAPGSVMLLVPLTSLTAAGRTARQLSIGYTLWWLNNEDRSTHWSVDISTGGDVWAPMETLSCATPATAETDPLWSFVRLSATVDYTDLEAAGIGLADGGPLMLRWTAEDHDGSGGRDESAIDDLSIGVLSVAE